MNRACSDCQRFNLKNDPAMAALGYGRCQAMPVATFVHVRRVLPCQHYRPAPEGIGEARRVWWAKKSEPQPK